ncbi:stage II sporulation protein D [Clostridium massiliodielmoense]|uniref:stage II sporulation protein D n=1 Tax=Clostridium massiliodielmoense TaxID=1776385 RepID=UPI0004D3D8E1|nr:stage II sporulation protein D [Clostridium massiliodielmoense]KEH97619.1 sporulation protein [Clostridium botulinum C/D str. BKT12695]
MKKVILSIALIILFITGLSVFVVGVGSHEENYNVSEKYIPKDESKIKSSYSNDELKMKVYITKKKTIDSIELEDYVKGVVSAEMPVEFPLEALKSQAVAARTYALAHKEIFGAGNAPKAHGGDVNDTTDFQVFMYKDDRMKMWPKSRREEFWNKITQAIEETEGEVLSYDGELVMSPYYFSTSGGKTEDAINVFNKEIPYLKSVDSPGEEKAHKYISNNTFTCDYVANKLNNWNSKCNIRSKKLKKQISILEKSKAGTVMKIKVGEKTISGSKFRSIIGLNSSNFTISFKGNNIIITCRGYGHGVGMSQWGSKAMASKGYNYKQILKHYYKGTDLIKLNVKK